MRKSERVKRVRGAFNFWLSALSQEFNAAGLQDKETFWKKVTYPKSVGGERINKSALVVRRKDCTAGRHITVSNAPVLLTVGLEEDGMYVNGARLSYDLEGLDSLEGQLRSAVYAYVSDRDRGNLPRGSVFEGKRHPIDVFSPDWGT